MTSSSTRRQPAKRWNTRRDEVVRASRPHANLRSCASLAAHIWSRGRPVDPRDIAHRDIGAQLANSRLVLTLYFRVIYFFSF